MTEPANKDTRSLALGLALAAAACLVYAAFTREWLVNASRHVEVGFGLRSNYECATGLSFGADPETEACAEMSNSELIEKWRQLAGPSRGDKYTSGVFAPLGWITFVLALLAAAGLLGAAALAAARKQLELPVAPTTIALLAGMLGLITGCVFVATRPGPPGMVGVGLSFWIFGAGTVMGILAAQLLAKLNRPPDPEWTVE